MRRWLELYEQQLGTPIDPMAPLFPTISSEGRIGGVGAQVAELMATIVRWATEVGLPKDFIHRLTPHSFRSGGCSDALNSGCMTPLEVQRQGRWSSSTFEMYVHLRADALRESLAASIAAATQTTDQLLSSRRKGFELFNTWMNDMLGKERTSIPVGA